MNLETKYNILAYVSFCLGILTTERYSTYAEKKSEFLPSNPTCYLLSLR